MDANYPGTNHILIVDDEPKVAFFLGRALERYNSANRVTISHSGEEALQILGTSDVDVLVTDLRMPGISGLELIRWARASSPRTRSILITAYGSDEIRTQAYDLNASRYITKPFDIQQFTRAVEEALLLAEAECALTGAQRLRDLTVSLIFHHLRVPLTHILGNAYLLAEDGTEQDQMLAKNVVDHSLRMRDAIDDFTLLAEWSIGQISGFMQNVDVETALETTAAQLASLALVKEQVIQVVPPQKPITVNVDSLLLGILLTSIISGAIRFTCDKGRILASAAMERDMLVVTAQGEGERATEEYMDPDQPGVALTVAEELAVAMKGELRIEKGGAEGTTIKLSFPVRSGPEE
jgi:CheY-like chemotaxis protein